jgi:hypothetical protein
MSMLALLPGWLSLLAMLAGCLNIPSMHASCLAMLDLLVILAGYAGWLSKFAAYAVNISWLCWK